MLNGLLEPERFLLLSRLRPGSRLPLGARGLLDPELYDMKKIKVYSNGERLCLGEMVVEDEFSPCTGYYRS